MAKQSKLTNRVLFSEDAIIILILPKSNFSFFYNVLISLTWLSEMKDIYIVYEYHYWRMFLFLKKTPSIRKKLNQVMSWQPIQKFTVFSMMDYYEKKKFLIMITL